ncbi:MAG TPA: response regulator transcription factor [Bacteroidales bacterium]|mgnify:CR=1 FL=1|nr:response regulator transcription factor [Bacteroidales bacterium]
MAKIALIVEDHPIVSDSIARLVGDAGLNLVCLQASTGSKGLAILNGQHIDIVLLDIHLPDMSGIEFCSTSKQRFPNLKILAITSLTQRHIVEQMLEAGAEGFVLKTSETDDILTAISEVIEGNHYLGKGVKELMSGKNQASDDIPFVTRREAEVLKLIADGFTNLEISEKLFISPLTVDSHRKNLLLKFNAKNTASLVKEAVKLGLI